MIIIHNCDKCQFIVQLNGGKLFVDNEEDRQRVVQIPQINVEYYCPVEDI